MRIKVERNDARPAPLIGKRLCFFAGASLLTLGASVGAAPSPSGRCPDWGAAMALLATDDYRGALLALDSERDEVLRLDGKAQIYYAASDPGAALEAAEAGLRLAPGNLNLLFRATASALWLGAGERAMVHNRALGDALSSASLSDKERALWQQAQEDYGREAQDLIDLDHARAQALSNAHRVAWIGLGLLLAGMVWALCSPASKSS